MRVTKAEWAKLGNVVPPDGKATVPAADAMNRLERRYADRLELLKVAGEIWRWDFQSIKFRLADNTFYTPDFVVYLPDGRIEIHETKGFWEEDARVKFKVAAESFPFPFVAVQWVKKAWVFERIEAKRR